MPPLRNPETAAFGFHTRSIAKKRLSTPAETALWPAEPLRRPPAQSNVAAVAGVRKIPPNAAQDRQMCCAAWCRSGPAPVACPPPPFGQKPSKSALRLKDEKPWPTAALHPMRGHPAGHRPQPCQAKGRGRTRATRRPATVGTPIPRPPTPHCSSAAATTLSPARPPSLPPPAPKPNVPPKAGDRAVQTGPASPGGVHALPRPQRHLPNSRSASSTPAGWRFRRAVPRPGCYEPIRAFLQDRMTSSTKSWAGPASSRSHYSKPVCGGCSPMSAASGFPPKSAVRIGSGSGS